MSTTVKSAAKQSKTKTKEKSTEKKKKNKDDKKTDLSKADIIPSSSLISTSSASHQQHHSAPPPLNPQTRTGLQSIHEHNEYLPSNGFSDQRQTNLNSRLPRSTTVPYPAYATVRTGDIHRVPVQYSYPDQPTFIHGTLSSTQANTYLNSRQPFSLINSNFQPISPQHQQYSTRPVDILKPTFLIVPKEAEQQLTHQLSASNSPVPQTTTTTTDTIKSTKPMPKKIEKDKREKKTVSVSEKTIPQNRSVEVQTSSQSPTRAVTYENNQTQIGLMGTQNPSPYIHFVNVPYTSQSPYFYQGPPETSIIQDEFIQFSEYQQPTTNMRSMPNIAVAQGSPGVSRPLQDDQQKQQQGTSLANIETTAVRSSTVPQMSSAGKSSNLHGRTEIGETDESSVISLDFGHTDLVDVPGSWRYRSVPVAAVQRRYRQPIPQAFYDSQQYASDSEQVIRSASYRHPQQMQPLIQSRTFGSIPTINRPFDSIRSQHTVSLGPSIRLSEKDVLKIGSFYQSIGTLVYVARSVATLYTSDFDAMANLRDWKKLYTGVPIWLFNTGMNPKRERCIRLIMSELGSSFTLWDAVVNGASDVRLPKSRHITLKSLETGTILALKFDDASATEEFHQYFVKLSSNARNADLFDVFNIKRHRPVFVLRKRKIKKSAISKPSEFNHITKVDEHDRDSLYTYSVLVDDGGIIA